jgi:hypothetical protein
MSTDLGYALVAAAIIAVGYLASRACLRDTRPKHDADRCECHYCAGARRARVGRYADQNRWRG